MHPLLKQDVQSLVVVCHDAGAANALSAFAGFLHNTLINPRIVCSGHAGDVFRKAGITPDKEFMHLPDKSEINALFEEIAPEIVIMGTSFDGLAERWFCEKARIQGIYCLAFVDWWSNFGRRFSSPDSMDRSFLPDAIAVIDEDAKRGCMDDGIPEELLHISGNPYFDLLYELPADAVSVMRSRVRQQLGMAGDSALGLIISSNIRNLNLDLGYDENDFMKAIMPLPEKTISGSAIEWVIKPHPKESVTELRAMASALGMNVTLLEGVSGLEAVAASDLVIGMCSSLLFEAALLGRRVLSLQPGLDQEKLKYLRIFDHIGIPKIIKKDKARDMTFMLAQGQIPLPGLKRLPFPVGGNTANEALLRIMMSGLSAKRISVTVHQ